MLNCTGHSFTLAYGRCVDCCTVNGTFNIDKLYQASQLRTSRVTIDKQCNLPARQLGCAGANKLNTPNLYSKIKSQQQKQTLRT